MIVSCPACATHYHHAHEEARGVGRCSQCDERFPMAGTTRRYVVMPSTRTPGADPLLAAGLSATEHQVDRPVPPSEVPELPIPEIAPPTDAADDEGFFGAGLDDDEALFGIDDGSERPLEQPAAETETEAEAEAPRSRPAHPVREACAVFLLAGLGAAAGYHGSLEFGFATLNAIGVGLGVGITFGWAWIRWAERER